MPESDSEIPAAGLFETARGTVHAWQRDHMGHINVRAYAEFFEEAAWQVYNHVGITPSLLRSGGFHLAVVQQDTRYKRELLPGDVIAVRSAITGVRERVIVFVHYLANVETGALAVVSTFTVVCLDSAARKSRAFPEAILARARSLLVTPPAV